MFLVLVLHRWSGSLPLQDESKNRPWESGQGAEKLREEGSAERPGDDHGLWVTCWLIVVVVRATTSLQVLQYCCKARLRGLPYIQFSTLVPLKWDGHQMELEILLTSRIKDIFTFTKQGKPVTQWLAMTVLRPWNKLTVCTTKQRKRCLLGLSVGPSIYLTTH